MSTAPARPGSVRRVSILALTTTALVFGPCAQGQHLTTADQYYTGIKRYVEVAEGHPPQVDAVADLDSAYALGALTGIFTGMQMEAGWHSKAGLACVAGGASDLALARTYVKYVDDHPAMRGAGFELAAAGAFFMAYPCLLPTAGQK